jgi:hypothetical protein
LSARISQPFNSVFLSQQISINQKPSSEHGVLFLISSLVQVMYDIIGRWQEGWWKSLLHESWETITGICSIHQAERLYICGQHEVEAYEQVFLSSTNSCLSDPSCYTDAEEVLVFIMMSLMTIELKDLYYVLFMKIHYITSCINILFMLMVPKNIVTV